MKQIWITKAGGPEEEGAATIPVGAATPTAPSASALSRTVSPNTGDAGANATYTPATALPTFTWSVPLPGSVFSSPL